VTWGFRDETYGDKENRRRAQMRRAEKEPTDGGSSGVSL
jgi:hypothetical protein